jgi:DNA polymerase-3 subunit alpha
MFFFIVWENCKALAAVDEILALKGAIEPARDKNQRRQSFFVSSIQDINRLIRAAARKAAEDSVEDSTESSTEEYENGKNEKPAPLNAVSYSEIHIRLAANAAKDKAILYSLRDCMEGNPGSCPVYIHVPVAVLNGGNSAETIVRSVNRVSADSVSSIGALTKCAAVAEVWGAE